MVVAGDAATCRCRTRTPAQDEPQTAITHDTMAGTILAAAAAAAIEGPPGLPPVWTGVPTANYTMPGYDGGTLNIAFYSDCSRGASLQRMKTVYPDTYTVITYCDRGWSYLLQPQGPGPHTCVVWPVAPGTCEVCACPF